MRQGNRLAIFYRVAATSGLKSRRCFPVPILSCDIAVLVFYVCFRNWTLGTVKDAFPCTFFLSLTRERGRVGRMGGGPFACWLEENLFLVSKNAVIVKGWSHFFFIRQQARTKGAPSGSSVSASRPMHGTHL